MSNDSEELKERISKLSEGELLTMVNVRYDDYRQEALDFAVAELVRRGVSMFGLNRQPQEPVIEEKYKGVKGLLLFFCLGLVVFRPIFILTDVVNGISTASKFSAQFPALYVIAIIDSILAIGSMCFSIYAGVALLSIKPNAVTIAKTYLLVDLGFSLVRILLLFMSDLPEQVKNSILWTESIRSVIGSLLFWAIWSSYLISSKRVQATYS